MECRILTDVEQARKCLEESALKRGWYVTFATRLEWKSYYFHKGYIPVTYICITTEEFEPNITTRDDVIPWWVLNDKTIVFKETFSRAWFKAYTRKGQIYHEILRMAQKVKYY